ncbi:MAG TPA: lysophospholipid acyltransferase family protein [Gemmatimonadales bacterium]|nr:lysophospholipid acyltransferase family protein [Gemmatimonadales bacterium]
MRDFLSAARYWVTLFVGTVYYGLKVIFAATFRVPYRKGGVYDHAPVGWGRFLLRANGLDAAVEGLEHLSPGQPYVFVSNHLSWVDIWALITLLPDSPRFVSKKELRHFPIIGRAMAEGGQIFIDRQQIRSAMDAYQNAANTVRSGHSAVVFAEGTRSRTGELLPFKKGPFVLAIAAQVPAVPVRVIGTFQVLPSGSNVIRPGPITVRVGAPIPTSGMNYEDRDRLSEVCRVAIEDLV